MWVKSILGKRRWRDGLGNNRGYDDGSGAALPPVVGEKEGWVVE
jgi:hypothetical protein